MATEYSVSFVGYSKRLDTFFTSECDILWQTRHLFAVFCLRYKAELKRRQTGAEERLSMVPASPVPVDQTDLSRLPDILVDPDVVFLCRYVYDIKLHRILKNPPAHPVPIWQCTNVAWFEPRRQHRMVQSEAIWWPHKIPRYVCFVIWQTKNTKNLELLP